MTSGAQLGFPLLNLGPIQRVRVPFILRMCRTSLQTLSWHAQGFVSIVTVNPTKTEVKINHLLDDQGQDLNSVLED